MKDHKQLAKSRIAAARNKGGLAAWEYVVNSPDGYVDAVLCKKCGTPCTGLVEHDRRGYTRMEGGQLVKTRFLVMAQLPAYDSVVIEFKDGTAHETVVCKTCKPGLTAEDLEAIYAADIDRLDTIDKHGVMKWEQFSEREIDKVREVTKEKL